jgi:hypothetical protein
MCGEACEETCEDACEETCDEKDNMEFESGSLTRASVPRATSSLVPLCAVVSRRTLRLSIPGSAPVTRPFE